MCQGGWKPRGALLAPSDAFDFEPVILPYVRSFVPREERLTECGGPFTINDVEIRTSIRHRHAVETYGLHFRQAGKTVSYLPCTRFFPELIDDYRAHRPDVLIVNVLRFRDTMDVDHLTFDEACTLIAGIRPKTVILTHFGTKMLEQDPHRLARGIEDEFGLRAHAAYDGWTYDAL
jgi:phosphoribosyl 1,2-cyclic phosphodiesterase